MSIKSILIVDDSESDQFITQVAVQDYDQNIKILKAYDGSEALKILQTLDETPSFILLDINMPLMNGFEFLDSYKEHYLIPVVVMSSSNRDSDHQKAISYDIVKQYIAKPIDVKDIQKLEEILLL